MSCTLSLYCNVQAIMETDNGRDYLSHVSFKKNHSKNRHQVIRDLRKSSK